jgi:hypothetical protein
LGRLGFEAVADPTAKNGEVAQEKVMLEPECDGIVGGGG